MMPKTSRFLAGLACCVPLMCGATMAQARDSAIGSAAKIETEAANGPVGMLQGNRPVEIIVVWGFRIRSSTWDARRSTLTAGYQDLIDKAECQNMVCGFVTFYDGTSWRLTTIQTGPEERLRDMQAALERPDTTLVIVHPTGEKRSVPNF